MKEEDRKIGPEIHCTDLKLSRNLSAHVRKSGVDEVTMMHGWIIRYLFEDIVEHIEEELSEGISEEELHIFYKVLDRINQNVKKYEVR